MKWLVAFALLANATTAAENFTSSDVADAAERLTGRRAHLTGEVQAVSGVRMSGPAVTMRVVRDDSASLEREGLAAIAVVEEAAPGSVIVVAMGGERDHAVFGATFATLAESRGLNGFVIDGAVRGAVALRRIGFPIFARGFAPGTAGGHFRLEAVNVPVELGGLLVSPGDLVVADEDGVAIAPRERVQEVLAKAVALRREKEELLPLIAKYRSYLKAVQARRAAAQSQ